MCAGEGVKGGLKEGGACKGMAKSSVIKRRAWLDDHNGYSQVLGLWNLPVQHLTNHFYCE